MLGNNYFALEAALKSDKGSCNGFIGSVFYRLSVLDKSKPLVITFQHHGSPLTSKDMYLADPYVWGFDFLKKLKYNVLSFSCLDEDNWYRCNTFITSLNTLSKIISCFPKRLGYGSSMGGYAVGAFSEPLNIESILLMNPISTLKSNLVPWEVRFKADQKLNWDLPFYDGANSNAQGYVIYDPIFDLDHKHAKRYKNLCHLRVPGVGHSMPGHLIKLKVLKNVVHQFLSGSVDKIEFYKAIRGRRSYYGYYKWLLSHKNKHLTPKREMIIRHHKESLESADIPRPSFQLSPKEINLLRDAALVLEKVDLKLAKECMGVAHKLRPEGALIKNKLIEYERKLGL